MHVCIGSVSFMDAHFGRGSGIVLMDYLYCRGSESTLLNCSWTVRTSSDSSYCDHSRDVGVRCAGKNIIVSLMSTKYSKWHGQLN